MSDLTDADLEAMEKRWQEATKGPWEERSAPHPDEPISKADYMASLLKPEFNQKPLMVVIRDLPDEYLVVAIVGDGPNSGSNAEFIARSYEDIPALIAALREARAEREEARRHAMLYQQRHEDALAENRLLREAIEHCELGSCYGCPMVYASGCRCRIEDLHRQDSDGNPIATWLDIVSLTAAEAERVLRLEEVAKAAKVVVDNRDDRFTDDGLKSWSSPDDMIALEDALAELDAGEVCGG